MRSLHHRGIHLVALAALALCGVIAACGDDAARECRVGADCASGVCGSDGVCFKTDGPSTDGGPTVDGGPNGDGGPGFDAGGDSSVTGCVANKDGTITRDEVPIQAGLKATYKIGTGETVSTAGVPATAGRRTWDFSAPLASDMTVLVETLPLKGKWYENTFAGATYATKLTQSSDLLGVFETSPTALLLRGVVSPSDTTSKTQLTNTPPVTVLSFPLKVGAKWNTDASVSGTLPPFGAILAPYSEKYTSEVDAAGELKTPFGTFEVLRVKTVLVRTYPAAPLFPETYRTFAFVTECFGTVATVGSAKNETEEEFTNAAEIRRLSP